MKFRWNQLIKLRLARFYYWLVIDNTKRFGEELNSLDGDTIWSQYSSFTWRSRGDMNDTKANFAFLNKTVYLSLRYN